MIGLCCEMVAFVGLNPLYADESITEPTIRRCINFTKEWGFKGIYILNTYAFSATNPRDAKAANDPVIPKMINCFGIMPTKRLQSLPAGAHTVRQSAKVWFAK